MKKLTPFVLLLACIGLANAQNATFGGGSEDEKAVRQTEMRRFELTVQKDLKALAELLGDDLTYTHSNGLLDGKEQYLATLEGCGCWARRPL
ncbi:MAG: nuclear transport factor 2 family protein [Cytophagales bacterium]|nr:nuclear transport factor 2 family protein [Cytophagales bacterium]